MARKKIYASKAEKQRAYRQRKLIQSSKKRIDEYHRLDWLHLEIKMAAEDGEPLAVEMLGKSPFHTAINLVVFMGNDTWTYADEYARMNGFCAKIPDKPV